MPTLCFLRQSGVQLGLLRSLVPQKETGGEGGERERGEGEGREGENKGRREKEKGRGKRERRVGERGRGQIYAYTNYYCLP